MTYTFDHNIFSDLHKDAYGFRPRGHRFYEEETTDAERQKIWDALCQIVEDNIAAEREHQARALRDFENLIQQMKDLGAETTRQAIKWVFHGENLDRYDLAYGADYVAYHFGMAYDNKYRSVIQECVDQALATIEQEAA